MIHSKRKQALVTVLPILSLFCSFGVVCFQSMRQDRLKQELVETQREYLRCEAQYLELRRQELQSAEPQKSGQALSSSR